ncbi:MAG: hypothetical protein ACO2OS_06735 [Thermosphaera aggregans]|jgi:hypothetical protein|uniref:hypothetical protein n=1 Tax=Thermosphaera aggregans TaxID=54254 RepID=UPI003C033AA4
MLSFSNSFHAGLFVSYPLEAQITPSPPPVVLTVLNSSLILCNLTKISSFTIYWSDFEQVSPDWSAIGGSWSVVSNGHKGSGLNGTDNDGGIGGASQYYLNIPLDSYTELYVGVKIGYARSGYVGIALINNGLDRLYEIAINPSGSSARLTIYSYGVESPGWRLLASSPSFPYTQQWVTLIVRYRNLGDSIDISLEAYSESGELLASVSASSTSPNRFPATYVALEIDGRNAVFDDFVLSTRNPANLTVTGLPSFAYIQVYDVNGSLVGGASADVNGEASISVVADLVTGVGDGGVLLITSNSTNCSLRTAIPIIGGEEYLVSNIQAFEGFADPTGTAATIFFFANNISSRLGIIQLNLVSTEEFHVRLTLEYLEATGDVTFIIRLESSDTSSDPIVVVNGGIISPYTSTLSLREGSLSIVVDELFYRNAYRAELFIEYCLSNGSVCVFYPLVLNGIGGGGP